MKVYWRSKEQTLPPKHAQFFLQPFHGALQSIHSEINSLGTPTTAKIVHRIDIPDKKTWIQNVEKALKQPFKKVVLARKTILTLDHAPDPFRIAATLNAQNASLFCIAFEEKKAFLGASPERLFRRQGREITVDAIAGTCKLGLEEELLASEKERREFQYVQDYLSAKLPLKFSPITLHKTAHLCHLSSQGKGQVSASDAEIIQALHPTPALCGENALEWILKEEPFDRGYYGGVFGWTTPEESDWTVAIRSCLLEGNTATLYAGTGIVAGSDPEKEWDELEAKIGLYNVAFN